MQQDEHLLSVRRYGERNPVRANLVAGAEPWRWSSARCWQEQASRPSYLAAGPVSRPQDWLGWVKEPLTAAELEALRRWVNGGTPLGSLGGVKRTAQRLHLQSSLRSRGRPRKEASAPSKKQTCLSLLSQPFVSDGRNRRVKAGGGLLHTTSFLLSGVY